jgi:heterotetrameric sarcosine oxidase gamma subunit
VSLAFLTAATNGDVPPAESPFAAVAAAAGATFEARDGCNVPTRFASAAVEDTVRTRYVGWADASHLGKLEIQVAPDRAEDLRRLAGGLRLGTAVRARDAWWCLVTPVRALVLCEPSRLAEVHEDVKAAPGMWALDVTTQFAALRLGGPQARELLARFCALDLRDQNAPVASFSPGSVARTPGFVLREAADQFIILTGAALAEYLWTVVSDAGRRLGGQPIGADAFDVPATPAQEAGAHA